MSPIVRFRVMGLGIATFRDRDISSQGKDMQKPGAVPEVTPQDVLDVVNLWCRGGF